MDLLTLTSCGSGGFRDDPGMTERHRGWTALGAPFQHRVFGCQQITDAYLLGLAVKENGVLVTLDKAIKILAGPQHSKNVLVLEAKLPRQQLK
jgi:hypothetical protein